MATLPTLTEVQGKLQFLWLELTDTCNLRCVHCYAESGPQRKQLKAKQLDYKQLLTEAAELGCKRVQFIGGEPTVVKELPEYISHARGVGFEFVEVYTNLIYLPPALLECFQRYNVAIATSFYSDDAEIHDAITLGNGSHKTTTQNIKRVLAAGLTLRAGIIVMEQNRKGLKQTVKYLRDLGVENVGTDRLRFIGRGEQAGNQSADLLHELCGSCWKGSLCVSPNGVVSPCIMSKAYALGTLRSTTLAKIVSSAKLAETRETIYKEAYLTKHQCNPDYCNPDSCNPDDECNPDDNCNPNSCNPDNDCNPDDECSPCSPSACNPDHECGPNCNPQCSPQDSSNCSPCFPAGKCNPELYDCSPYPT